MLLALAFACQLAAVLPSLTVRLGEKSAVVPVVAHPDGGKALRADLLAEALGGRLVPDGDGRFHIDLAAQRIAMTVGSSLAISASDTMPLSVAPYRIAGRFYVPMSVVSDVLPRALTGLLFDAVKHELRRFAAVAARRPESRGGVSADRPVGSTSTPPVNPRNSGVQTVSPPVAADQRRAPNARRRLVVVDAGHGGPDRGMTGPIKSTKKVYEKDITLAVSMALRDALEERGVDVLMTRTTDTLIALDDRGPIANKAKADLFISVHVNAANPGWKDPSGARGFETYFLSEAKTEDERRVAAMENESIRFETSAETSRDDPLGFIMRDMAQNEHLRESSKLASLIQRQLGTMHPGPSRGVKQAGFVVLIRAFMPAVLVEVGFGSNVAESAYMTNAQRQKDLAAAIADAAVAFLAQYERKVGPGTTP